MLNKYFERELRKTSMDSCIKYNYTPIKQTSTSEKLILSSLYGKTATSITSNYKIAYDKDRKE